MPKVFFNITIEKVSVKDLEANIDAFLKFEFANYKSWSTTVEKNVSNSHSWNGEELHFIYNTNYPKKLKKKYLFIELWDKGMIGSKFVGRAKINLKRLASGGIENYLSLRNDNEELVGHLKFELLMTQMLRNVKIGLSNVRLWGPEKTKSIEFSLTQMYTEDESKLYKEGFKRLPRWEDLDMINVQNSELQGFFDHNIIVKIYFKDSLHGRKDQIDRYWTGVLNVSELFDPGSDEPCDWECFSNNIDGVKLKMTGFLSVFNGPQFCQLQYGGINKDIVTKGGQVRKGFPKPSHHQPGKHIEKKEPAQIKFENIKDRKKGRKKNAIDFVAKCPKNWSVGVTKDNNVYFKYYPTKKTTWKDPRFLPNHWEQRVSPEGRLYFANAEWRRTTWVDPRALPDGWELVPVGKRSIVFLHVKTQKTTDKDPRGLPDGYSQELTSKGKLFFKDYKLKKTQWGDPRENLSKNTILDIKHEELTQYFAKHFEKFDISKQDKELQQEEEKGDNVDKEYEIERKDIEELYEGKFEEIVAKSQRWQRNKQREWKTCEASREEFEQDKLDKLENKVTDMETTFREEMAIFQREFMKEMRRRAKQIEDRQRIELQALTTANEEDKKGFEIEHKVWRKEYEMEKKQALREQTASVRKEREKLEDELDAKMDKLRGKYGVKEGEGN